HVDALAGQLAGVIADVERGEADDEDEDEDEGDADADSNGNGNGNGPDAEGFDVAVAHVAALHEVEQVSSGEDPGARRRYRFKHPTASGKTIAAAGFVDAARTTGVLILTHRRLLVDQF